ncbi:hypothetical protein OH764_26225 [Burkholderia sp. M6-3]
MNDPRGGKQNGQVVRWIRIAVFIALFATCLTWIGSIYDHPIDDSIMTGMKTPECASVYAMPAGSVLSASQPDSDICLSFFLYRTTHSSPAANTDAYVVSIMQGRVAEFWQLIGYVLLLWFVTCILVGGTVWVVRWFLKHHRYHTSRPLHH